MRAACVLVCCNICATAQAELGAQVKPQRACHLQGGLQFTRGAGMPQGDSDHAGRITPTSQGDQAFNWWD